MTGRRSLAALGSWIAAVALASACRSELPSREVVSIIECTPPIVEVLVSEDREIEASRSHCVVPLGDDAGASLVYDVYEFRRAAEVLHARSHDPAEAHFLAIERDGARGFLSAEILGEPLARAAIRYLHAVGKTELHWLDPANEEHGYSTLP